MTMTRNTVLSGVQPTAELHIGNYFGAIQNWIILQETYRCFYAVVDLHAMTMKFAPAQLRQNTERMVVDLLACGLDPEKATLFIQSLVPEHTELSWILSCVCGYGDLLRMTQFKEKSELVGDKGVTVGLFTYPVLQAADILAYRAQHIPVGKDQEQHLELSRTIARRFNHRFGDYFPEPKPLFSETSKVMSLADPGKKMSKSLGAKHYVGLFEAEDSIHTKVRAAVTDSGVLPPGVYMSPGVANLFEILRACGKDAETRTLLKEYEAGDRQYGRLKDAVATGLIELTKGLRARRHDLLRDAGWVQSKVREMSARAREAARETLAEVRRRVGLPPLG